MALLCFVISGNIALAQRDAPKTPPSAQQLQQIKQAIKQLGSADPGQRSAARNELTKFGNEAIPELEKAAKFQSTLDHEVQSQALDLVEKLREAQLKTMTQQFILGKSTLTGWTEFESICGDSPSARELYQGLHLSYSKQIESAMRQQQDLTFSELNNLFGAQSRERIALGLFLLTYSNKRSANSIPKQQVEVLARNLLGNASQFFKAKQKHQASMVKLVCAFLESSSELAPARKLSVLATLEHPLADLQLIELADKKFPPIVRAVALANLSGTAKSSTYSQLKKHFNDPTVVGKYLIDAPIQSDETESQTHIQAIAEVQIRDVCLLASLRIAKKTPTDFGFSSAALGSPANKIDVKKAGFTSEATRENAFKLWRQSQETRTSGEQ